MQKSKSFTTSCGFCGLELVLPDHRRYHSRRDSQGKQVLQTNHFCDTWCWRQYKKLQGLPLHFAKLMRENRGDLIKRGLKLGSKTKKIYTSEFLRNLLNSPRATCAYPDCDGEISKIGPRSKWNCCPYHTALVTRAVWAQNKRRRDAVRKHGVEPIEQTFVYLPQVTLVCANCKTEFVRSGQHALLPRENVYCSKVCQFSHRKTKEISCVTCGSKFRRYGSREWKYCSQACYNIARQSDKKEVVCQVCGMKFTTYYDRDRVKKNGIVHKKQKFCSWECFDTTRIKTGGKNVSNRKEKR